MKPSFGATTTRKGRKRKGVCARSWGDGFAKRVFADQSRKMVDEWFKNLDQKYDSFRSKAGELTLQNSGS